MSEIADTIAALDAHEARLDAVEKEAKTTKAELLARIDQFEKTVNGLLTIMRDGVSEECRLVREGINRGRY